MISFCLDLKLYIKVWDEDRLALLAETLMMSEESEETSLCLIDSLSSLVDSVCLT